MRPNRSILKSAAPSLALAGAAHAEQPTIVEDELGILNPQDTGREMLIRKIEMGIVSSITCSLGINATKYDNHELSRKLTRQCAEAGYTKAMTWMGQLENNGLGGECNPDASAEWDRRAADADDTVGRFNYGLNLMRGHGFAKDEALGRNYVDHAAQDGLAIAKCLQGADYDLDEVTPNADNDWANLALAFHTSCTGLRIGGQSADAKNRSSGRLPAQQSKNVALPDQADFAVTTAKRSMGGLLAFIAPVNGDRLESSLFHLDQSCSSKRWSQQNERGAEMRACEYHVPKDVLLVRMFERLDRKASIF